MVKPLRSMLSKLKHTAPILPHSSTLLEPDHLGSWYERQPYTPGCPSDPGSAGPGGCDSTHWQDVTLRYGFSSRLLRDCIAELTCHMANSIVDWVPLRALLASRLIALHKSPGIGPIGVGETLRQMIGKTICLVTIGRCRI